MTFFKNRKVAILITIFVVVFATLFGVGRSLNRLAANTERMFFDGVYLVDQGFTQPALNTHLENIAHLALDCASVFANHPELYNQAEEIRLARRDFLDANSIWEKYIAHMELRFAFYSLFTAADHAELSDEDRDAITRFSTTLSGAVTAIENSAYNEMARNFMDGVSGFAKWLHPFALFVTPPQIFEFGIVLC